MERVNASIYQHVKNIMVFSHGIFFYQEGNLKTKWIST